jgi:hypothetical protein
MNIREFEVWLINNELHFFFLLLIKFIHLIIESNIYQIEQEQLDLIPVIADKALGITNNMIYLNKSGLFGSKKDRVTHISLPNFMEIYEFVKLHIK